MQNISVKFLLAENCAVIILTAEIFDKISLEP